MFLTSDFWVIFNSTPRQFLLPPCYENLLWNTVDLELMSEHKSFASSSSSLFGILMLMGVLSDLVFGFTRPVLCVFYYKKTINEQNWDNKRTKLKFRLFYGSKFWGWTYIAYLYMNFKPVNLLWKYLEMLSQFSLVLLPTPLFLSGWGFLWRVRWQIDCSWPGWFNKCFLLQAWY